MNDKTAFEFIDIPARSEKIRKKGLTMVLDKGIGLHAAQDMMQAAPFIDIIKLGWATPRLLAEDLILKKIESFRRHNITVGNGGTLLEIACQQGRLEQFLEYCRHIGFELIEVSNGVMPISSEEKAKIIHTANDRGFFVISEVGKKDPAEDRKLSLQDRISEANSDMQAGARYVIIEAREGGKSLGIYDEMGDLKEAMARGLVDEIGIDNIMFEAPEKAQQAHLILLFGPDVNLGNIRPEDVIPLETLRRGIRGDTCGKLLAGDRQHSYQRNRSF